MKRKKEGLEPLKDIISAIFSNSDLPFNPDDGRIWQIWNEVVGSPISRHAQPSWIKERRLRVKVTDSIWLQELEFCGEDIKERINEKLGRKAITEIEFRLGTGRFDNS